MVLHVIDALGSVTVDRIAVVVGASAERVSKKLQDEGDLETPADVLEVPSQRGTGDAVSVALTALPDDDLDDSDVVVIPSDLPLLRPETVSELVARHRQSDSAATLLTVRRAVPRGYGRVVRGRDGRVTSIVAEADATEEQLLLQETTALVFCFRRSVLAPALRRTPPDPMTGEYYVADVIGVLRDAGYSIEALEVTDQDEVTEVDDRLALAAAEAELRRRTNLRWMAAGVNMVDPASTYIDATVTLGGDVTVFPNTYLQGRTVVGDGAELGPDTRLVDCMVGEGARVEMSSGRDAEVGPSAQVGPYAVLEPGAQVPEGARVRPFTVAGSTDA
jgi:bifunctional UDP-N-acetylglucosamine pyrophosphorylase/glucosamine-1-phosphate N-acetyltransferase